ncbi:MAG: tRNA-intron lyase [Candidatus Diapherotrites archaeon]|nr:tRNA-intron lyase [Candidatus Diapherotrites archaeon]
MSTRAELLGSRVLVKEDYGDLVQRGFGEKKDEGLVLSLYEAAYLLERGKIKVFKDGEELDFHAFLREAEKLDPNFLVKYTVFRDIRNRGYVIKTGFKFGTHFRVYPRGKKPGEAHTQYVVQVITEEDIIEPNDLSRMVRVATGIRTKLLLAFVDSENDVVYYKVERISL